MRRKNIFTDLNKTHKNYAQHQNDFKALTKHSKQFAENAKHFRDWKQNVSSAFNEYSEQTKLLSDINQDMFSTLKEISKVAPKIGKQYAGKIEALNRQLYDNPAINSPKEIKLQGKTIQLPKKFGVSAKIDDKLKGRKTKIRISSPEELRNIASRKQSIRENLARVSRETTFDKGNLQNIVAAVTSNMTGNKIKRAKTSDKLIPEFEDREQMNAYRRNKRAILKNADIIFTAMGRYEQKENLTTNFLGSFQVIQNIIDIVQNGNDTIKVYKGQSSEDYIENLVDWLQDNTENELGVG